MSDGSSPPARVTDSPRPRVDVPWVEAPELSIVIVAFGTGLVLDRCLESLADSCAVDEIAAEVIVVDNAHPRRGHAAGHRVAVSTRGIRLMQPDGNLGFGGGNNAGVAGARAPMIALVNPDVMLVPGQLPALLDEARDHPQSICAPALVFPDGTVQEIGMRIIRDGDTRPILESGSHAPDYASAACWVLSTALFNRLGGFDSAFHPAYYEDVDFALRVAVAGGGTRIVESVRVVHEHHSSTTDAEPDVARQRGVFVNRWVDLVTSRPAS